MARKAVANPPDWLRERIGQANSLQDLVESDRTVQAFGKQALQLFKQFREEYKAVVTKPDFFESPDYSDLRDRFKAALNKRTDNVCPLLVEFVTFPSNKKGLEEQLIRLKHDAKALRELAEWSSNTPLSRRRSFRFFREYLFMAFSLDGTLNKLRTGPLSRIADEGLVADRLRICPICDRICWMKKTTSKTCGKKQCSDRADYLKNKIKGNR